MSKLRHARKLIPNRQSHLLHHIAAVIVVLGVVSLVVQQLYPADKALPYVRVNGETVSGLDRRQLIDYLYYKYSDAPLTVNVNGQKIETRVNEAGLIIDYIKAVEQAISYRGWERAVPFSSVFKAAATDISLTVLPDQERLEDFVVQVTDICHKEPKDAGVAVDGQMIKLVPGVNGRQCPFPDVKKQFESLTVKGTNTIQVILNEVKPERTDQDVLPKLADARGFVNSKLRVAVIDKYHEVPSKTIAGWLKFEEDKDKNIVIALKDDKIHEYLSTINKDHYIEPGKTTIYLIDGQEVRRDTGQAGRGIDMAVTTDRIKAVLSNLGTQDPVAWAGIAKLEPAVVYSRNYSHTQAGLELFLTDLANEKGSYGIALHEIGGPGRVANAYGSKQWVMGSTYKLIVAHYILKKIESGELKWDSEVVNGMTVTQCFDEMIVVSTNLCSVHWGNQYGWGNMQDLARSIGMASTTFGRSNFNSTPLDEALFLRKLEIGELLRNDTREFLLGLMKRQVYRSGIPRGVQGTAANKIGFVDGYLNDVAIVYGRQGTYVLSVLTYGGSWGGISDAARRIDNYLNE